MPFELLQVTAAYSNAVLVAIMPHISQFARTLALPISQPVTIAQVKRFGCSPRADHIGGRVLLTNGYSFTFDQGAVVLYRSPLSYYSLQEPERISQFYGQVKIKKDEATRIAQTTLTKLGYSEADLHLAIPPKVKPPPVSQGKQVARYFVEWIDPSQVSAGGIPLERTAVEVDASTGVIQMLGIQTRQARRPDPQVAVRPPVIAQQPQSQLVGGTKVLPVSAPYARAFLVAILPQISDYVTKAGIDVKVPITIADVDIPHYDCGLVRGLPRACLYLKNGDRFWYEHGQVIEFEARDSQRWSAPNKPHEDPPPEKFFGPIKVSADEALAVVRKALANLGYPAKVPRLKKRPEIVPPQKYGTNYFARYFFNWWPNDEGMQIAVAEVDATTKKLKSLGITDLALTNIWRQPPQIALPMAPEVPMQGEPPPPPSPSQNKPPPSPITGH
ncbi:MAG: hypothetical protein WCK27_13275 [Verrucomicrobiota bacterium]